MKRKTLYGIAGVALIAAVVAVVIWQVRLRTQVAEPQRSAVVERGPMRVVVAASGQVVPIAQTSLTFEAPGQVAEVAVRVGDRVTAGQVLARMDTRQLELQVQQAQAGLLAAEAQLAMLQADPKAAEVASAEANLRSAEASLSAAAAGLDQVLNSVTQADVAAAETQLASAQMQERLALQEYDTVVKEVGNDTGEQAVQRREQAGYKLLTARQQLEAAQAALDDLLAGADADSVRAARANLAAAQAQRDAAQAQFDLLGAGTTREKVAEVEAQVEQARAAVALAQLSVARATLTAPFDGEVSAVNAEVGEMAMVGRPAFVLLDTSHFRLNVSVDEIDVVELTIGQQVDVVLDAFPDVTLTGVVARIAPTAHLEGGVTYYDAVIDLERGDVAIRADMTATASMLIEELPDVLTIPTSIVQLDQITGQPYVYRQVEPGEYQRVDVSLGVLHEGRVEVLDGLAEGETVYWVEEQAYPFAFGSGS